MMCVEPPLQPIYVERLPHAKQRSQCQGIQNPNICIYALNNIPAPPLLQTCLHPCYPTGIQHLLRDGKRCYCGIQVTCHLIAAKREKPYSNVMGWLRCHLSFSLLRSTVMCLSSRQGFAPHVDTPADLVVQEGHIPSLL